MFRIQIQVFLAFFGLFLAVGNVIPNFIDTNSDINRFSWKLFGDYLYIQNGDQLLNFKSKFPNDFSFTSVSRAKGIWIVFPSVVTTFVDTKNIPDWTNIVMFSFSASAQLIDSISIKFIIGGNSTIKIVTPTTIHTINPDFKKEGWLEVTFPFEGSRFTVEATAHGPGDYLLIDRIDAPFLHTTTSSRRPKTTTTPLPINRVQGCPTSSSCTILISISIILWTWTKY